MLALSPRFPGKARVFKKKIRGARPVAERRNRGANGGWRSLLAVATAIMALAGLSYSGFLLWQSSLGELSRMSTLEQVRVRGPFNAVTQRQIEETLLPFLQKGFFAADIRGMREALLRNPWITSASVSRRWPRGVEVEVQEAQPLAVWGGDKLLVASGELLPRPVHMRTVDLPELAGDEELVERIVVQYQALAGLLTTRDMEVRKLSFDELSGWRLELTSGVELHLGHRDLLERVNRFLQLSRGLLAPYMARISRVDARYSNAVAVQWKRLKKSKEIVVNCETAVKTKFKGERCALNHYRDTVGATVQRGWYQNDTCIRSPHDRGTGYRYI